MSTIFEWRIPTLDINPKHVVETSTGTKKTLKGVITGIHWRLEGTSDVMQKPEREPIEGEEAEEPRPFKGSVYGSQALDISELDGTDFASYEKTKTDKALLLKWLFEAMGKEKIAELEEAVEQRIKISIEAAKDPLDRDQDSTTESVNL